MGTPDELSTEKWRLETMLPVTIVLADFTSFRISMRPVPGERTRPLLEISNQKGEQLWTADFESPSAASIAWSDGIEIPGTGIPAKVFEALEKKGLASRR